MPSGSGTWVRCAYSSTWCSEPFRWLHARIFSWREVAHQVGLREEDDEEEWARACKRGCSAQGDAPGSRRPTCTHQPAAPTREAHQQLRRPAQQTPAVVEHYGQPNGDPDRRREQQRRPRGRKQPNENETRPEEGAAAAATGEEAAATRGPVHAGTPTSHKQHRHARQPQQPRRRARRGQADAERATQQQPQPTTAKTMAGELQRGAPKQWRRTAEHVPTRDPPLCGGSIYTCEPSLVWAYNHLGVPTTHTAHRADTTTSSTVEAATNTATQPPPTPTPAPTPTAAVAHAKQC